LKNRPKLQPPVSATARVLTPRHWRALSRRTPAPPHENTPKKKGTFDENLLLGIRRKFPAPEIKGRESIPFTSMAAYTPAKKTLN